MKLQDSDISPDAIAQAERLLAEMGRSYDDLAEELAVSSDEVASFFRGLPLAEETRRAIATALHLLPVTVETVVAEARQKMAAAVLRTCDRLRGVLFAQPVALQDVYVPRDVAIAAAGMRVLSPAELARVRRLPGREARDCLRQQQSTRPALEVAREHPHLILQGGRGAGKTTLLKHLALQCVMAKSLDRWVPLWLDAMLWGERAATDLWECAIAALEATGLDYGTAERLLQSGAALVLVDNLDTLPQERQGRVLAQIGWLSDRIPENRWIVVTRDRACTQSLEGFTEATLCPLTWSQIAAFVRQWFQQRDAAKGELLLQHLQTHAALTELATSPLLLTTLCRTMASSSPTDPLALLYPSLCRDAIDLAFDRPEEGELPITQAIRAIGHLAFATLDRGDTLFDRQWLETILNTAVFSPEHSPFLSAFGNAGQLSHALTVRHGLLCEPVRGTYGFTHVAMQEYLAASRFASSFASHGMIKRKRALAYLLDRLGNPHWHYVFVGVACQLECADRFLLAIQQRLEEWIARDPFLQKFLMWVNSCTEKLLSPYKPCAVRAYYLDLDMERTRQLDRARALELAHMRTLERAREKADGRESALDTEIDISHTLQLALNLDLAIYAATHPVLQLARALDPKVDLAVAQLKAKLPDPQRETKKFKRWWHGEGPAWAKQFRSVVLQHRRSLQELELNESREQAIRTLHDGCLTLADCLQAAKYVSPEVRDRLLERLLLPVPDRFPPPPEESKAGFG